MSVDEIIAGFYTAAFGAIPWTDALGASRSVLRAGCALNLTGFAVSGRVGFSFAVGSSAPLAPEWGQELALDPRTALLMQLPEGGWMHCDEQFDAAFVAADPFYQQQLIPSGGRWLSATKLHQDESITVLWAVLNGVGSTPLDAVERARAQHLACHLRVAVKLQLDARRPWPQVSVAEELLRQWRHAVLLVDGARTIHFASTAAQSLMAETGVVSNHQGLLMCRDAKAHAKLLLALRRLGLEGDDGADAPARQDRQFLRLSDGADRHLAAYLFAVQLPASLGSTGARALATVLLHDPQQPAELDAGMVSATWNMTGAEARAAMALAQGMTPHELATQSGLSLNTIRSQIQGAMAKTGARRQAQLVSLLLCLPPCRIDGSARRWHTSAPGSPPPG